MRSSVLALSASLLLGTAAPAAAAPGLVELGRLPGDLGSRVAALNDAGETAGESFSGNVRHAVKWSRDGRITRLPDLGGGQSAATDINNSGTVVGSAAFDAGSEWAAVRWDGGRVTRLPAPYSVGYTSAAAISETGIVVGSGLCTKFTCAWKWVGDQFTQLEALPETSRQFALQVNDRGVIAGVADLGDGAHVVRWDPQGRISDLGTFGGDDVQVTGINAAGVVVGSAEDRLGQVRPFRSNAAGGLDDLGVGSGGSAHALALNDLGEVVGESLTKQPRWVPEAWSSDGTFRSLEEVPGDPEDRGGSRAWAINNAGVAVGESRGFPVRWNDEGQPVVLDNRPGGTASFINRSGLVAGTVHEGGFPQAVLWR